MVNGGNGKKNSLILWFDQITIEDTPLVGGKNSSLGEMYRELGRKGVNIPNGFAVTTTAYRLFVKEAKIEKEIKRILSGLNIKDVEKVADAGLRIRELIKGAEFPQQLKTEILEAYARLCKEYGEHTDVAVRSSATAEDLADASFAGQQESYLNIRGHSSLLQACKLCLASLFTNRAIVYRHEKGFDHFKVALSIGVQKMVRSDKAGSGVIFTIDTESGFKDAVVISAGYGLGENIVKGRINPDEYMVFKPTLMRGFKAIISKKLGDKKLRMAYSLGGTATTRNVVVPYEERKRYVLEEEEILTLARWACIVENHYSQKNRKPTPMDLEWAKDGVLNKLFIVQARPETVQAGKDTTVLDSYALKEKGKLLARGLSVGNKIGQGKAHVIKDVKHIKQFKAGEVLVTEMTDPDWVPVMKQAAAIVTNRGGRACFSGDTKLLTNRGFLSFETVFSNYDDLYVASLNRETLKVEWKKVYAAMRRRAHLMEVEISQTGRQRENTLKLTPNHKMLSFNNRELVEMEAQQLLDNSGYATIVDKIPAVTASTIQEQRFAYLLGALSTDGHISLNSRHGTVEFTQKPTENKKEFINTVIHTLQDLFHVNVSMRQKPRSGGIIRDRLISGEANSYRVFNKALAEELLLEQESLTETMLEADESFLYSFLAGVIDGDGTYNHTSNRINIYCGKEYLLHAVVVGCLRLGIVPQIVKNRTISNIQITEKVAELLAYTKRVKGSYARTKFGTKLFAAKQLLADVVEKVNYKGRIKPYVNGNLLIDARKIEQHILPLCDEELRQQLSKIVQSDLRSRRMSFSKDLGEDYVYNISVEGNHNYLVFTSRYTPVLVNNCHAAIVSRELGITCVVGTNNATEKIAEGQKVTVSCAEGEEGRVYDGLLKYEVEHIDLEQMPKTRTKVMVNIGSPEEAFKYSFLPVEGVGLAREEFIINNYIAIHPLALVEYDSLKDVVAKKTIEGLTYCYKDKKQYFIDKLAEGVATIAAAFYPHDVIVRLTDFKSNEYANLIGGHLFEPKEENPMLGWRGASRYYSSAYKKAFELECKAIIKAREEIGLTNVKVMVPMCRTPEEGKKVIAAMASYGLKQHKNGLEVYVMCEVPSNVILAEKFADIFDGFSIGSNDLTQFTLAVDRDSELISHIFNERNDAVKWMVRHIIEVAKRKKRKIGICGQAPSDYEDFAEFLVECGIDSISLNPDAVVNTLLVIANAEKKLHKGK